MLLIFDNFLIVQVCSGIQISQYLPYYRTISSHLPEDSANFRYHLGGFRKGKGLAH
jgi:hypothetical protein